jgi:hypothetical protein
MIFGESIIFIGQLKKIDIFSKIFMSQNYLWTKIKGDVLSRARIRIGPIDGDGTYKLHRFSPGQG